METIEATVNQPPLFIQDFDTISNMAIRTTQWIPDTCKCVINIDWDDSLPETDRVHTYSIVSKCETHAALSGLALKNAITGENTGKNQILNKIHNRLNALGITNVGVDDVTWSFDQDRKVILNVRGISEADRDLIIASLTPAQLNRLSVINIVT